MAFCLAFLFLAVRPRAASESVTLFRVFLNDGTAVVSYGEYARVGDRVVFSMPIGAAGANVGAPTLHVVNIPAAQVDWTATGRYADSVRFEHYIATSAEADYASLTGEVAGVLNSIMFAADAQTRLKLAMTARQRLASWPRDHYGYRADDVKQVLGMLDEAISELRAAAGETAFALDLIATADQPRSVPALPEPTPAESIAQAVAIIKVTDVVDDRVSLLQAVVEAIDNPRNAVSSPWARSTRRWAANMLGQEQRTDKAYGALASSSIRSATAAAARADVRSVERTLENAERRGARLGGRRPEVVAALLAQVRVQLDSARRLRLARDQWKERLGGFQAYQRAIAPALGALSASQRALDDIKRLAGSEAVDLFALGSRLDLGAKLLATVSVPDQLKPSHALLLSATNLAATAISTRRSAVTSGVLKSAWDASSAAAGSMMLYARAREDMAEVVNPPHAR